MLQNALLFLTAFAGMELIAYLSHKYLMHGSLWFLHESHHRPRTGIFEKNDLFGIAFATPAVILIYLGSQGSPALLSLGLGIAAYGIFGYFFFHDIIVHRRIRIPYSPRSRYMRRIVQGHGLHHAVKTRDGAVSFGFLYTPPVAKLRAQLA